ncbi:MAG TPA: hypothetical protein VMT03_15250 [Polyangia bacterium]|nr:hypothetical protein [Polyangia bacterium]
MVFVDDDGTSGRKQLLESYIEEGISVRVVVAVPAPEFEGWLIADHGAVAKVLEPIPAQPPAIEALQPGQAKQFLAEWISQSRNAVPSEVRSSLANLSSLSVLDGLGAFQAFRRDLLRALTG